MTCIAAIHSNGRSIIGAERYRSIGTIGSLRAPKLIVGSCGMLGFAGPSLAQSMVEAHKTDILEDEMRPFDLAMRVRELLKDKGGFVGKPKEGDYNGSLDFGAHALLARPDGIWFIGGDFTATRCEDNRLTAIGSGADFAEGAARAIMQWAWTGMENLVRKSIGIACELCDTCDGPIDICGISKVAE
jgi:ATP-dependent protease HslVU (ClpYQ) peptidase subunit